ncbi:MAG: hypothetical protein VX644_16700, partial [Planctomycetota bacterium]|nr:hypothetical protein [Planctomycetota bacterium]
NYAEAHVTQGIISLLQGNFKRGWLAYEWRRQCSEFSISEYQEPVWDGSSLEGRTILVHHEQGLGDMIQFVRYATIFARQGARVIVKAQKSLVKLLEPFQDIDTLVTDDSELPEFDVHVPMLSIPGKLQTTFDNIPTDIPYLQADESLVDQWRERLLPYDGFKVGIVWQGSPCFETDPQRSIPVEYFFRLAGIPGVRLFSLQKGYGAEQLESRPDNIHVVDFGEDLDGAAGPFMDTAAILRNLDLLISSDTSVPHLAGALGVRSWVALSLCPDWRWFLDREDSPWYPTMRLFRQERLGEWDNVFDRIATDLAAEVGADPPPPTVIQSLETDRQG